MGSPLEYEPQLGLLAPIKATLPPLVARADMPRALGGAVAPKLLANADARGEGPAVRLIVGGRVCYPPGWLVAWLEGRTLVRLQGQEYTAQEVAAHAAADVGLCEHLVQCPPLGILAPVAAALPPLIYREAVGAYLPRVIAPRTLANADGRGQGPLVRLVVAGRVCYPTAFLCAWLEERGVEVRVCGGGHG